MFKERGGPNKCTKNRENLLVIDSRSLGFAAGIISCTPLLMTHKTRGDNYKFTVLSLVIEGQ